MPKISNFEIILGTYEEFVVGYRFLSKNSNEAIEFTQSFASHSHNSSVRCITHSDHYLATGGADDRIVVYDLKSRKEHCWLTHHNGAVNCLAFTEGHTHLISGSSDGVLAITRVGNWQLEKIWEKAHKGASIIDIAIHPSNKLALTLGADCTLRTWNLIKGRQAYVINLNSKLKDAKSAQSVKWAPNGVNFVLCAGFSTDIWSIEGGGIVKAVQHKNKVCCSLFYSDDVLIVGFENGILSLYNYNDKTSKEVEAHTSRLKSVDICKKYIITCASNGEIKVWNKELKCVSTANTGCRNTCLTVVVPNWIKKEEDEEEQQEEVVETDSNVANMKKKKKGDYFEESVVIIEEEMPKKKRKSKGRESYVTVMENDGVTEEEKRNNSNVSLDITRRKKRKSKDVLT